MGSAAGYIALARKEIGTTEQPPGSNKTPFGVTYGWNGVYWCAIFLCAQAMYYGLRKNVDYPFTASVFQARAWAKKAGRWSSTPHVGDWVVFTYSHIEVVTKVEGSRIRTIGGNTSLVPGHRDRDGGGVWEHWRPRNSSISGYIRINYSAGKGAAAGGSPAKLSGGILGMSQRKSLGSRRKVALRKNVWRSVPFKAGHYSFVKADGDTVDIDSDWTIHGLKKGKQVQFRYFVVEYYNWGNDSHTYRKGDRGGHVDALQRFVGVKDDGVFGADTQNAVEKFQRKHGLKVDGVAGNATKKKLSNNRRVVSYGAQEVTGTAGSTFKSTRLRVWPTADGQDRRLRVEAIAFEAGVTIVRQNHRLLKGS